MAGTSNDSNPERARVSVWLGRQPLEPYDFPDWLGPYEQEVASGMATGRLMEFVHSRWLVRQALHGVSGRPPHLCRPVHGRPVASAEPAGWHLSLSHSHGMSACAVSSRPGLGVDIEPLYRETNWRRIVRRWFTEEEQDWLLTRGSHEAFLKVWTLKEAWLKATGRGIANNLRSLRVSANLELIGDRPDENWHAALTEAEGYMIAAVWQDESGDAAPSLHRVRGSDEAHLNPAELESLSEQPWVICPLRQYPQPRESGADSNRRREA
ncbi:4'-phosphopantetheinyl transferase [Marinobacter daqiaonensis]|uniref:4'-phosphopantetheinyl transferase n=1 Tax=Marinobacter daqiaonensis TaxID=650891 RepID=A0A1I6IIV1_9GAMM|nr:4'-phosphopantetheinyl transferase superfamily protein [Marinobacter daqiaonensis]SFR66717.1 4'-phosphopantetheinyl transferase [Marinobacter daqiaonensis]